MHQLVTYKSQEVWYKFTHQSPAATNITTSPGIVLGFLCVSLFFILILRANSSIAQTPSEVGEWRTLSYQMPINPIHLGLLHTGKVLISAGSGNNLSDFDEHVFQAAVWDPQSGTITPQDLEYDLFCNGMAFLPDGRTLSVGGTEQYDPFHGDSRASIFDPATEQFIQVQSMQRGRWYATATALSDGQILTFSGIDETNNFNSAVETYKAAFGWSPESVAPWTPPLYPWLHLLPNGKVFYSGATPDSHIFDPAASADPVTHGWTLNVANTVYGRVRKYGSSVLLPLLPPMYTPRVMILGGADIDADPANAATPTTEIIDLSNPTPTWQLVPPMSAPRIQMNAVLLPDGKLLALGGSEFNEDTTTASHSADLFDPAAEPMTVASAGVATFDRFYHSMALLLPDATVAVVGSNPGRGVYEKNIEIYSPPYLFNPDGNAAVRPIINSVPSTPIGYGGPDFQVQAGDSDVIGSVVLVRPGSPTHAFDMEQRLVGLNFSPGAAGVINVTPPPATNANGANIAPPGYYMLFVLNGDGVPSVAKFIQLSLNPDNLFPEGTITSPATDVTIQTGQTITFNGSANNPHGGPLTFSWVFPDVVPDSDPRNTQQNPGAITFPTAGTYVVSLTVADSAGATDPSPPTVTVTVAAPTLVTLHINRTGTGSGSVTSNPSGISCPADCDEDYLPSTVVTLTATADIGSVFTGWSGGWCSGTGTCQPTLNNNPTTVTANFNTAPTTVTLNVTKTGAGGGMVTSNPAGIDCGATCSNIYNFGTSVTLTATADAGSAFNGWSGGGCSGLSTCTPTLNSDPITVNAEFISVPPLTLVTSPLPDAEVGVSYDAPLVSGGIAPYTFSFLKGSSPPGLNLDSSNGTLHGMPMSSKGGSFMVRVNYPSGSPVTGSFKITVRKALSVATNALKAGTHGVALSRTLKASGGEAPYSWSLAQGSSLPPGLNLASSGTITGTPTLAGTYPFTVQVNDPLNGTKQKGLSLTIK